MLKNLSFRNIGLSLLLLLGVVGIKAQIRTYESVPNDPMKTRIYTLDNGLKIYITVNKEKPRIQTYIAVRTGSRNDPAETTGLAHYLEHIMFKGTDKFGTSNYEAERPYLKQIENLYEEYRHITDPVKRKEWYHKIDSVSQIAAQYNIPNEYDKLMAAIGSQGTNAYTSNDVTCYVENIPSNEIDSWAKVQGDRFQNMVIRGFHTELEAVYEEYNMGLTSDGRKLFTALMAKLFPNHPYGTQTTIGRGEHLKNPSITNIMNYYHRYYVPNNIAICLSGDLNPDETVATIEKYFGNWKKSETLSIPQYGAQPKFTHPVDTTVVGLEAETVYLGWRGERGNSLQCDTLNIISNLLSNGHAGLFDLDLNQTMKVQSAGAGFSDLTDYSMFIALGTPKKGQTLQEVRNLLLAEIEKLKKGEFSDDLLPSVINNYKRSYYKNLDNNQFRAKAFVNAFINNVDWKQEVGQLDRISKMTKAEIVSFANRFFTNGYAAIYKVQGTDTTIHKVDKPKITPIPTNNDKHSTFLQTIVNNKVEPIKPVFVDLKKDLTKGMTKKGWPILYKQNTQDDLFTLYLQIPFGKESDILPTYAKMYLDYLGTDKMTNAQIKQELYKLACDYDIEQSEDETYFYMTGLNENLPKALALINYVIDNAKVDKAAYNAAVDLLIKSQKDNKADQKGNFRALQNYGMYGPYNSTRNILSEQQLKSMDPQKLLNVLKNLKNYKQTVLYYGPSSIKDIDNLLAKTFKTAKKFAPLPKEKRYTLQTTPQNEVIIAPYNAKNIYMVQFHNENKEWNPNDAAKISLFNEYFGGGMNAIVFQEMREARALAYTASASYHMPNRLGDKDYFNTFIITQNDKMMDCIAQFNELLNNMPVRLANFDLAKQNLLKSLASTRTTKFSILSAYMNAQKMGLNCTLSEKIYNDLPSVTFDDIINFEKTNIGHKTFKYLILGDEKELDMKALEKIAPIKRVTTEEIFGY